MLRDERREPTMMGFGMGGGMIAMTVFWVALLALVIWGVSRASTGSGGGRDENPRRETPEEILDRRYVAGELEEETYRSMRETLTSARSTPR
jgi:putative membrane protein